MIYGTYLKIACQCCIQSHITGNCNHLGQGLLDSCVLGMGSKGCLEVLVGNRRPKNGDYIRIILSSADLVSDRNKVCAITNDFEYHCGLDCCKEKPTDVYIDDVNAAFLKVPGDCNLYDLNECVEKGTPIQCKEIPYCFLNNTHNYNQGAAKNRLDEENPILSFNEISTPQSISPVHSPFPMLEELLAESPSLHNHNDMSPIDFSSSPTYKYNTITQDPKLEGKFNYEVEPPLNNNAANGSTPIYHQNLINNVPFIPNSNILPFPGQIDNSNYFQPANNNAIHTYGSNNYHNSFNNNLNITYTSSNPSGYLINTVPNIPTLNNSPFPANDNEIPHPGTIGGDSPNLSLPGYSIVNFHNNTTTQQQYEQVFTNQFLVNTDEKEVDVTNSNSQKTPIYHQLNTKFYKFIFVRPKNIKQCQGLYADESESDEEDYEDYYIERKKKKQEVVGINDKIVVEKYGKYDVHDDDGYEDAKIPNIHLSQEEKNKFMKHYEQVKLDYEVNKICALKHGNINPFYLSAFNPMNNYNNLKEKLGITKNDKFNLEIVPQTVNNYSVNPTDDQIIEQVNKQLNGVNANKLYFDGDKFGKDFNLDEKLYQNDQNLNNDCNFLQNGYKVELSKSQRKFQKDIGYWNKNLPSSYLDESKFDDNYNSNEILGTSIKANDINNLNFNKQKQVNDNRLHTTSYNKSISQKPIIPVVYKGNKLKTPFKQDDELSSNDSDERFLNS
ncbi:hypothetical protein BN7_1676 [Wickerhamomyces ciferrii]|uniref:Copper-fist domain-containing protein n=1 Tax=Wickerhamomyces ciferrii (strain ATCC 14091 / BCRC 22168 / CBS 111 / JCM 3599 / NBRC 0793 / NRRL Y-1031 F-60-10) TaxID=1206466 RepID=K0KJ10_WICCF|nr:uncharacterized protein BN7_1676 [Wickerhamomyces ciferrii]CCH42132.1 hypothetical protein BN7_1676 [Wickerhamomyces ciferrii]